MNTSPTPPIPSLRLVKVTMHYDSPQLPILQPINNLKGTVFLSTVLGCGHYSISPHATLCLLFFLARAPLPTPRGSGWAAKQAIHPPNQDRPLPVIVDGGTGPKVDV